MRKGDVVSDFELPDETGTPRRLSELLAGGPVVLFFYPAALSLGWSSPSGRPMRSAARRRPSFYTGAPGDRQGVSGTSPLR